MEPGELGEPMQEKLLVLFGAADKRERWLLDGHKKERSVRRLPGFWCLLNSTGEDLRLVEV